MVYKKSAVSSAQIVSSAIRVLARSGYARTSLMDIAKEAGMSKGAVHYHFPSKESLVARVLETACDAVAIRANAAWAGGVNPLESLHSSLEELWRVRAERSEESLVIADLLAQSLYDDVLRPKLAAYYAFAVSQLTDHLIKNVLTAGFTPRLPPPVIARLLIGLLDGLVMQHWVEPGVLSPTDVVRAVELTALSLFELPKM